ncbi:glycine cleavage system protein T [Mycolicibacterium agri]|uniref:Aminomethyltransferase n=1 Tax=Mycolicibacterium agri TaxID=36811 RepID=A0A2A7MQM8_MYCAG|nr:glycine cleavage system aminomethyltransferase GcvT [Mycolicibacterium agri]PEG33817.1 glycine cleavage system protein T [Mycolicibacterium agri]GFG52444.1 aminomethyltransferase [Mycolicibacterium agri]
MTSHATTTLESPLLFEHRALGATFTDFAGWQMPVKYSSDLSEHHAVRRAAGVFDISHMGEIVVAGPQAAALLDYSLVGELSKIAVGKAKYSLMCESGGGVIDDLVTYRLSDRQFLVVVNAANTAAVMTELTRNASLYDVEVEDRSDDTALIAVQGPVSESIVEALVPAPHAPVVKQLKYYAIISAVVADIDVQLARTGYTGEDGFELYVPRRHAISLWRALLAEGSTHGAVAAGLACRDTLRLEAGMPLYGHELSLHTNPYEAGLGMMVRLTKEFVGREALQRISQRPTDRTLVGLKGTGRRAARAGYRIHHDGADSAIGVVTSGALSPTLGYPIAMAYVASGLSAPGTEVTVDIRGSRETFQIVPLPFYRRG